MKGRRRWASDVPTCPLYKATEWQCVFCDGQEFSSLRISFPDKHKRAEYMSRYCEKDYEHCKVYQAFINHNEK